MERNKKIKNILLVYPPLRKESNDKSLPLGLLYVAASLLKENYKVQIMDFLRYDFTAEDFIKKVQNESIDIIGIGGIATTYLFLKQITDKIKQVLPKIPIVCGGFIASSIPEYLMKRVNIDYCVIGEGEYTFINLLKCLETYGDISLIRGIAYRKEDKIIITEPAEQISNLDLLPLPAYHLIDMDFYTQNDSFYSKNYNEYYIRKGITKDDRVISIISGRGCIGRCTFCFRMLKKYKKHSIEFVIRHMEFLKSNYGIKIFSFIDELTLTNNSWSIQFLEKLKESNLNIVYLGQIRGDQVSDEIAKLLSETGCLNIFIGFESGNQNILNSIKKTIKISAYKKALEILKKYNIFVRGTFIIGLPGESMATFKDTMKFILDNPYLKYVGIFFATAYPGSELFDIALKTQKINNIETYLKSISDKNADSFSINFTDLPDNIFSALHETLRIAVKINQTKYMNSSFYNKLKICILYLYLLTSYYLNLLRIKKMILFRIPRFLIKNLLYIPLRKISEKFFYYDN